MAPIGNVVGEAKCGKCVKDLLRELECKGPRIDRGVPFCKIAKSIRGNEQMQNGLSSCYNEWTFMNRCLIVITTPHKRAQQS